MEIIMKLVNVVERMRYKKEIVQQIHELAPEMLTSKNIGNLVEKLHSIGAVTTEEKTYFETRLHAKVICLMVEKLLEEHGLEGNAALLLVDRDNESKYGKLIYLSAPHMPKEVRLLWDEEEIDPFNGVVCRAILQNKIVDCKDIRMSPLYAKEKIIVLEKYGIITSIAFPIRCNDRTVMGALAVNSRFKMEINEQLKREITAAIQDLEHIFTCVQERWKNKNVIRFRNIMSPNGTIMYVDPIVENEFGYRPFEINQKLNLHYFIHPEDIKMVEKDLEPLFKENRTTKIVFRCLTKKKDYKTTEILFIPIKESDGTIRYYEGHVSLNTEECALFNNYLERKTAVH